jgi:hypothetical protein
MKKFIATVAIAGLSVIGGFNVANAQTSAPSTTPSPQTAPAPDRGRPARPANGGFAAHAPAIAKALGMTVDELNTALDSGKTIAGLAKEKGVDVQTIITAYVAEEQAEHPEMSVAEVTQRVTDRVNGVKPAKGARPTSRGNHMGGRPGDSSSASTTKA